MQPVVLWRGILAAGLLALAPVQPSAAEPDAGAAAWAANCAKCHRTPSRILYAVPDTTGAGASARLDRFLAQHHATDEAERAAIIAWLQAQASQ